EPCKRLVILVFLGEFLELPALRQGEQIFQYRCSGIDVQTIRHDHRLRFQPNGQRPIVRSLRDGVRPGSQRNTCKDPEPHQQSDKPDVTSGLVLWWIANYGMDIHEILATRSLGAKIA